MPIARTTLAFAAAILAIPAVVSAGAPIGEDGARHLLARTGFGPTAAGIATHAPLDRETAVARCSRPRAPPPPPRRRRRSSRPSRCVR
jgi:hypothetical protein